MASCHVLRLNKSFDAILRLLSKNTLGLFVFKIKKVQQKNVRIYSSRKKICEE